MNIFIKCFLTLFICSIFSCLTPKITKKTTDNTPVYATDSECCIYIKKLILETKKDTQFNNGDSNWRVHLTDSTFLFYITQLSSISSIPPKWHCGDAGCSYYNFSLNKSIFRIDLLQWLRFFKCKEIEHLLPCVSGRFSKIDSIRIAEWYKNFYK